MKDKNGKINNGSKNGSPSQPTKREANWNVGVKLTQTPVLPYSLQPFCCSLPHRQLRNLDQLTVIQLTGQPS
jgi:hypothetical protein